MNDFSNAHKPIDVVIAWVDGNDPVHKKKIDNHLPEGKKKHIPGAQKTRFGNVNELKYCVLSVFTFAPFVRNIFIVTDRQTPPIMEDVKPFFPDRVGDIRMVDHQEIFEGFEDFLPVFNSRSIESMIWRIKDLSENFVYFNDDSFLIRPVRPEDWFIDGRPVIRGQWMPSAAIRVFWDKIRSKYQRQVMGKKEFEPRASYHTGQWNAAKLLGFKWRYFVLDHTPHAVNKDSCKQLFDQNLAWIKKNISYKFRHFSQFNFLSLTYHLEILAGDSQIQPPQLAYLQPLGRKADYIDKKIKLCESNPEIIYMCVQSLDLCAKADVAKVFGWLEKIMDLETNDKR